VTTAHVVDRPAAPTGPMREELRGRGTGMIVLSLFALLWASWGTTGVSSGVKVATLIVAGLASVSSIAGASVLFRRSASTPSGAEFLRGRPPVGRRFGIIVAAEFIGIFAVARILAVTGHTEFIAPLVCLAVGVHFFPLRRLFHVGIYGFTAWALCAITVVTFVLAPLTGESILWTLIPGYGAALVLYATCARLFQAVSR
jgi:hypothetical protein